MGGQHAVADLFDRVGRGAVVMTAASDKPSGFKRIVPGGMPPSPELIERLRACRGIESGDPWCYCKEAADEIERLRAVVEHCAVVRLCSKCAAALEADDE